MSKCVCERERGADNSVTPIEKPYWKTECEDTKI